MKTNSILKSEDRNLFGVQIRQETKTQMLNISDLQLAYDKARFEFGWNEKRIDHVTQTEEFKERCFYILEKQGVIKPLFKGFMQEVDNKGITKVLKEVGYWKTTGARNTKTVYCNPYIWTLIAMELNPKIYANVVIWLTDSLIFNRLEAGTEYLPMNQSISKIIDNPEYYKYAVLINKKVFGIHQKGIRDLASSSQLKQITEIERTITVAIDNGWIKNDQDLIKFLQ